MQLVARQDSSHTDGEAVSGSLGLASPNKQKKKKYCTLLYVHVHQRPSLSVGMPWGRPSAKVLGTPPQRTNS